MLRERTRQWLLTALLALGFAGPLWAAEDPVPINPLEEQWFVPSKFRPWAPVETPLSGYPRPNRGLFFQFDQMFWWTSAPNTVPVGADIAPQEFEPRQIEGVPTQEGFFKTGVNTLDTGQLRSRGAPGQRYEFGYVGKNWGWLGSITDMRSAHQQIRQSHVEVLFNDTIVTEAQQTAIGYAGGPNFFVAPAPFGVPIGRLTGFINALNTGGDNDLNGNAIYGRWSDKNNNGTPYDAGDRTIEPRFVDWFDTARLANVYTNFQYLNRSFIKSYELSPFYRFDQFHDGGTLDVLFGIRLFKFTEAFEMSGQGGIFTQTDILTLARNNVLGPQWGFRYFRQLDRMILSTDWRFMPGINMQTVNQVGIIGSNMAALPTNVTGPSPNTPILRTPMRFDSIFHRTEFSPLVEGRFNFNYQVTKSFYVTVGWTGTYVAYVARPTSMVNYTLPEVGIRHENAQDVFAQGVNLGFTWNR